MKIGDHVKIINRKHPWYPETGRIIELMHTPVGEMWKVKLDKSHSTAELCAGAKDGDLILI